MIVSNSARKYTLSREVGTMLTVDRPLNPVMNSSRIYRGVPKPAVDFLARNKRALRKKAPGVQPQNTPSSQPKKPTAKQVPPGPKSKTRTEDVNTVVINKSYLENLLRMNVVPQAGGMVMKDVTHVQLESSQVPGLESPAYVHTVTAPQPAHPRTVTGPQQSQAHTVTAPQPTNPHTFTAPQPAHLQTITGLRQAQAHTVTAPQNNTPITAKEQWLRDLAEQVREKKERQNKQTTTKDSTQEVYFPFGRPGCGAPIRTESGQVIADLRSKVRSSYEGPIQQAPTAHKPEKAVSPPAGEYFPYGRPGCGAPNNTGSHGISYQPYGGDVPTSQQAGSYPTALAAHTQFQQPYSTPSYQPAAQSQLPPPLNHTPSLPHNPSHTEEYYPYGRPGGGAPVTTHTHPPLPSHPPTQVAQNTVTSPPQAQDTSIVSPREGFGRGAGPYVDKFVLQDMDQRRRKELEYRAELAEQIAAQQREKEAKRLAREREEAMEEATLAQEREKLNRQYQREVLEKRRKEELAMQRQMMLQQGIEQAKQSAQIAKMEAKGTTHPTPSTHSPAHTTHTVHRPHDQNTLSLSSKFDSVLRSPSMLHLKGVPQDTENSKKTSRIPVRRSHHPKAQPTPRRERGPSNRPTVRTVRPPSPPIPTLAKKHGHTVKHTALSHQPPPNVTRPVSPPVPTLAKRMSQSTLLVSSTLPSLNERERGTSVVRSQSPPVPTLAKRMSRDLLRKSHDQPGPQVHSQSPVPTLAKKQSAPKLTPHSSSVRQPSPEGGTIPINRLPSCEPVCEDSSPTLPAIVPMFQTSGVGESQTREGGPSRQQVILEQLAALKKGILSHQSTIDERVNLIMTRKRPNF